MVVLHYVVVFNYINLQKENANQNKLDIQTKEYYKNENLNIDLKDYYFSNVIARASKTMLDCHNSKLNNKRMWSINFLIFLTLPSLQTHT